MTQTPIIKTFQSFWRTLMAMFAVGAALNGAALQAQNSNALPRRCLELKPGPNNPRNSEGAFAALKSGRIIYIYSRYYGTSGADEGTADLAQRHSDNQGDTWSDEDVIVVKNEGRQNVMSVSLLRLANGELALFYLRKNGWFDCHPYVRFSSDDAAHWSDPIACVPDNAGYLVVNNDRIIQLSNGRLVMPVCRHSLPGDTKYDSDGVLFCRLSDDNGRTWHSSAEFKVFRADGKRETVQEPGVVELKDGRIMMYIRSASGSQMISYSSDKGESWTTPVTSTLKSPLSPAVIKRIPSTGDLLAVWNDHTEREFLTERRIPQSITISKDDGATWEFPSITLEGCMNGHYCYTAMHFTTDGCVLLGYSAMSWLAHSRITKVPLSWIYSTLATAKPQGNEFDGVKDGAFTTLETASGVWTAAEGQAEFITYARGRGIHLMGGANECAIEFTPKQSIRLNEFQLELERFTRQGNFALAIEAYDGKDWTLVAAMGDKPEDTGKRLPVLWAADCKPLRLRVRCISKSGVIIGCGGGGALNGFFND